MFLLLLVQGSLFFPKVSCESILDAILGILVCDTRCNCMLYNTKSRSDQWPNRLFAGISLLYVTQIHGIHFDNSTHKHTITTALFLLTLTYYGYTSYVHSINKNRTKEQRQRQQQQKRHVVFTHPRQTIKTKIDLILNGTTSYDIDFCSF